MDELETELSKIVGLDQLKLQLRKWARGMLLDERRRALGLKVGARRPPHMAFLGNPGTGIMIVKFPQLNYLVLVYVYSVHHNIACFNENLFTSCFAIYLLRICIMLDALN